LEAALEVGGRPDARADRPQQQRPGPGVLVQQRAGSAGEGIRRPRLLTKRAWRRVNSAAAPIAPTAHSAVRTSETR
jgi:hypothetical protein